MKFVSFNANGRASYGLVVGEGIVDLAARFPDLRDLRSFIAAPDWRERAESLAEAAVDHELGAVTLLPVIPNPEKILCIALNYHDHVAEADKHLPGGREVPKYPIVFVRFADSLVGHDVDIVRPRLSHQLDYEAELAVVIGKPVPRHVKAADALDYVFGYTAINEGSVRDYQFHTRQLTPGKNFEHSGSLGPWLITADEIPDPQAIDVTFRLNGEVLQHANTADMIFKIGPLIEYISEWMPLQPGDIIASGTMGGVGFTRKPPIFMKPGDVAEVVIEGIGTLSNGIRDEG